MAIAIVILHRTVAIVIMLHSKEPRHMMGCSMMYRRCMIRCWGMMYRRSMIRCWGMMYRRSMIRRLMMHRVKGYRFMIGVHCRFMKKNWNIPV